MSNCLKKIKCFRKLSASMCMVMKMNNLKIKKSISIHLDLNKSSEADQGATVVVGAWKFIKTMRCPRTQHSDPHNAEPPCKAAMEWFCVGLDPAWFAVRGAARRCGRSSWWTSCTSSRAARASRASCPASASSGGGLYIYYILYIFIYFIKYIFI